MATLLSSVSENGAGTGAAHTGPATVYVYGTLDGCTVTIEVSPDDSNYVRADNLLLDKMFSEAEFKVEGALTINGQGDYYIRASVSGKGVNTSVSAVTTQ